MSYIGTTRFNKDTWYSNCRWRENNHWTGCIYGSPTLIKDTIPIKSNVYILEMNNDDNTIEGIGLIRNTIEKKIQYKIYDWGNYNRYVYKGIYRIDKSQFNTQEKKVIEILEILLFKGSRHLKRGQGVIFLPEWIINNKHIDFIKLIKSMFKSRF